MNECSAYVGLDVHKDTIAVAVALPGREEPVYRGEIKSQHKSLLWLIRALSPNGELVSFCYEAGSCGYGVYREVIETGHHCGASGAARGAGHRLGGAEAAVCAVLASVSRGQGEVPGHHRGGPRTGGVPLGHRL